jgi:hypothetical protein
VDLIRAEANAGLESHASVELEELILAEGIERELRSPKVGKSGAPCGDY